MTTIAQRLADAGIEVKPLEWVEGRFSSTYAHFTVETPHGSYEVMERSDGTFGSSMLDGIEFGDLPTVEAAKSAAQADYTARILSALQVKP